MSRPDEPTPRRSRPSEVADEPESAGAPTYLGRRLGALAIDWAIASAISAGFLQYHPLATLAVFGVMTVVLLMTLGASAGHRLCGLRVYRMVDGGSPIGPLQALIRTAGLLLLVPAGVAGTDGRGLHDTWAGTFIDRFAAQALPPGGSAS